MPGSAIAAGEERVFSGQSVWPDRSLDRIGVHLDPAVVEERDQARPVTQGVTHGLREIGGSGYALDVDLQPLVQRLDDRSTSFLPDLSPLLGGPTADLSFNPVECGNSCQHFRREWRLRRRVELEEVAPHMGPAERQSDQSIRSISCETLEAAISIHLHHAAD